MKDAGCIAWVVTADQVRSRAGRDRVPEALEALAGLPALRSFERTAGDEIQGVLGAGSAVVAVARTLVRLGPWRLGVGGGPVDAPLPRSTRAGRGPAFVAAREALTSSRRAPGRLAVRVATGGGVVGGRGQDEAVDGADAQTVLWLLADLWRRRSREGWEVVELFEQGLNGQQAAQAVDVSPSAVSQRAGAARWVEGRAAEGLAARLLDAAMPLAAARPDPWEA